MAKWKFPSNGGGQIKGVADAGIENFSGNELASLVRENCQNSLDAAEDDKNPNVIVEFQQSYVNTENVPGLKEYRKILQKCKDFWRNSGSKKANEFLQTAINRANYDNTSVLRISDYNTVGLANPYCNIDNVADFNFDGWNALVKIDGGANKGDDKAGAYGIGKSAPFCNSYYRLVFYRTLNKANERAAQGISRLMSYKETDVNTNETYTTNGIGYFGEPKGNNPVESIPELDELNKRDKTGTDVFVYGFKDQKDLKKNIIVSLLDNFLMSLHYGYLHAKVQEVLINNRTLGPLVSKIYQNTTKKIDSAYGNFLVLTRTEGVYEFTKSFHGLGELYLRILVDPKLNLDRKILVVRKAGMKLFRLSRISKLVPFTGILELKGKELNSYFREMETVAHDNWEPARHSNEEQAKAYYEEIKKWIIDKVTELAEHSSDDEIDVEGLSDVLQDESDVNVNNGDDGREETLSNFIAELPTIIERRVNSPARGFFYGKGNDSKGKGDEFGETKQTSGKIGKEGESALRILKGNRHRTKRENHKGTANPEGNDIIKQKTQGGVKNNPLQSVRIIKQGMGRYTLSFKLQRNINSGHIEVVAIGENGRTNKLRIVSATVLAGCGLAGICGDKIEIANATSAEKVRITVTLADTHDYAMELNVYEHN